MLALCSSGNVATCVLLGLTLYITCSYIVLSYLVLATSSVSFQWQTLLYDLLVFSYDEVESTTQAHPLHKKSHKLVYLQLAKIIKQHIHSIPLPEHFMLHLCIYRISELFLNMQVFVLLYNINSKFNNKVFLASLCTYVLSLLF